MKNLKTPTILLAAFLLLVLISCAPEAACAEDAALQETSGFWGGILHGLLLPIAVIAKIFGMEAGIYAVNNTGTWYWVGYFIGFAVLGVGSHKSRRR